MSGIRSCLANCFSRFQIELFQYKNHRRAAYKGRTYSMIYIVTYDTEDDKIRSKLSKVLKGVGQWVQKSVFECELSKNQLKVLLTHLRKLGL